MSRIKDVEGLPELTDAGLPRKRKDINMYGSGRYKANRDIRDAMADKHIGQVKMAKIIGYSTKNFNLMLQKELPDNIREALLETIRRYDPDTNPMAL